MQEPIADCRSEHCQYCIWRHPDRCNFYDHRFDYGLCGPSFGLEWKKIEKEIRNEQGQKGFNGRFGPGLPRVSDGSLLFLLRLISKMRPAKDGDSRFGIVLNGSPLFTGGTGSGESEIRRYVLENDLVEGKPQPDANLRDTENVPLSEEIETYFQREVLPHAADAWIDHEKTKVGYEIPFNRHFYVFKPPRELAEIDAELKGVTDRILKMIGGLTQ